jgi:hypothetical protein
MRGSMISLCFRTATLAIASTVFMASAQQQSDRFQVSDNAAGAFGTWSNPFTGDSGSLRVDQGHDSITNSPTKSMELEVVKLNFYLDVLCSAPASAISSKTNNSVSLQIADISTCDGGQILFEYVVECTYESCVNIPIPPWSVSANWTKQGVRTFQQSGTTKTVYQDLFSGKILFSSQTSGIRTSYDAPFVVNVNGESSSGFGSINFSKGMTITFSPN